MRQTARGVEGATRRKRTRDIWWHASQLAEGYLGSAMHVANQKHWQLSFEKARHLVMRSLIELVRNPEMDIDSDSVHPLLLSTIPVLELGEVVESLRADFPVLEPEQPASASSSAPAAVPVTTVPVVISMATESASTSRAQEPTWWHDSRTPSEVAEHPLQLRPRSDEFKQPLDKHGKECAHYRRNFPPTMNMIDCRIQRTFVVDDFSMVADSVLRLWFGQRPELVRVLQPPQVPTEYVWYKDLHNDDEGLLDVHSIGRWYYFELRDWKPAPPAGTDKSTGQCGEHKLTDAIHASSMYSVGSTLLMGLWPGITPGKGNRTGVFTFDNRTMKRAISSSGYCMYTDLAWNGIFFGPRFVVAIQKWRVGGDMGAISVGGGQLCLQPGIYHLKGVYIHAVTAEMIRSPGAHQQLWYAADRWLPEYEYPLEWSSTSDLLTSSS